MKYRVTVEGVERDVEVQISPAGSFDVTLDGKPVDVDVVRVEGGLNLRLGGRVYDLSAGGKSDTMQVAVGADRATVSVQNERQLAQKRAGGKAGGSREVRSPMPGRVVKVLVAVGDDVAAGTPVVVVEAMKMENELRATAAGKVESVHAKAGDTVEGGALLIKLGE